MRSNHKSQLLGIERVEFYVGNAYQSSHYYRTALGFQMMASAGLETGLRNQVSAILGQGKIRAVFTSALTPDSLIAEHVSLHGDGIKDIAFCVADATRCFEHAVRQGSRPLVEPHETVVDGGRVVQAKVAGPGYITHSLIQRDGYASEILPPYQPVANGKPESDARLLTIDHIAFAVERGKLDDWVAFYTNVFGFHLSHEQNVATEYSGMTTKVVQSPNGQIKFPILEPTNGRKKSHISEFLQYNCGSGAQHMAFLCNDIKDSVSKLRTRGVEFLDVPDTYYEMLEERVGSLDEDTGALQYLQILVDREADGLLMQIFSRPVQDRPTFFLELIQRKGSHGFGGGNIRALFEAVERLQVKRGNL